VYCDQAKAQSNNVTGNALGRSSAGAWGAPLATHMHEKIPALRRGLSAQENRDLEKDATGFTMQHTIMKIRINPQPNQKRVFPISLTQGFFARFLEWQSPANADPGRGRFRSFILTAMNHFLATESKKARAGLQPARRVLAKL